MFDKEIFQNAISRLIHFIENNVDICRRWWGKLKESLENPRKNLPEMSKILNILIKKLDFLKSAKKVKHFWLFDFTYGIIKVQNIQIDYKPLKTTFDVVIILNAIGKIRTSKRFLGRIWTKTFDVLILPMALRMITTLKVVFKPIMTFDVVFDIVIFVAVINYFRGCDFCIFNVLIFVNFDILIPFINLFDVVIVYNFFDVLFGFRRCDIRSSDLFPLI